jgi:2-isopropylmalate synthase
MASAVDSRTIAATPRTNELEPPRVELYDTTLRDGLHGQGIHFRPNGKERIVRKLLDLGFDFVEAGFPQAAPDELNFIRSLHKVPGARGRLVAFGLKVRRGVPPERDPGLADMLACDTEWVALVGKTSAELAKSVLQLEPEENLDQLEATIRFLVEEGRKVIFLGDGFFEAYRKDRVYPLRTLDAARAGGAVRLVLCDTDGGSLPTQVRDAVADVLGHLDHGAEAVPVGFHGHNDGGLALANALEAVGAGVTHLQGTVNGLGDRCGNLDLVTVAPNLSLKLGRAVLAEESLPQLRELSRLVYDAANLSYRSDQPFVGDSAFAHKAGMHVAASLADPSGPYEHVPPSAVGGRRRILVSALAGKAAVAAKFKGFGLALPEPVVEKVLSTVKHLEREEGWQFDDAGASLYLLGLKELGRHEPWFEVKSYTVLVRHTPNTPSGEEVEAAVKLRVPGQEEVVHTVASGTGPLNALDRALRKALDPTNPGLRQVQLYDYAVRVIEGQRGTAGRVRVTLKTRLWDHDGHEYQEWGTCAVSQNLVEATWVALTDSLYFWKLLEAKSILRKHLPELVSTQEDD